MKNAHLISVVVATLAGCACCTSETGQSCQELKEEVVSSARTMRAELRSSEDLDRFNELIRDKYSWALKLQPRISACTGLEAATDSSKANANFWTEAAVVAILIVEFSPGANGANWRVSKKGLVDHIDRLLTQAHTSSP